MSLLTRDDTLPDQLFGAGQVHLPRVNLLPPEIAERRVLRRVKLVAGLAVLASAGVVGLMTLSAAAAVGDANERVDQAVAQTASLKAQTAQFADVTRIYGEAAAAERLLVQAMGEEIRYSRFLNDLSLTIPDNVWVSSVVFSQKPVVAGVGATVPGIGEVTVNGIGFSHDDVAIWLESLADQKGYADPDFSKATEKLIGPRPVVEFTSTATLTADARSGRFDTPKGS